MHIWSKKIFCRKWKVTTSLLQNKISELVKMFQKLFYAAKVAKKGQTGDEFGSDDVASGSE